MKKALYIVFIPLLVIEWLFDMAVKLITVIHNSIEVLTLATEKIINEHPIQSPADEGA